MRIPNRPLLTVTLTILAMGGIGIGLWWNTPWVLAVINSAGIFVMTGAAKVATADFFRYLWGGIAVKPSPAPTIIVINNGGTGPYNGTSILNSDALAVLPLATKNALTNLFPGEKPTQNEMQTWSPPLTSAPLWAPGVGPKRVRLHK